MMVAPKKAVEALLGSESTGTALRALDTVRAAGGEVSELAVELLAKIERGEITHEQALAELDKRYRAT